MRYISLLLRCGCRVEMSRIVFNDLLGQVPESHPHVPLEDWVRLWLNHTCPGIITTATPIVNDTCNRLWFLAESSPDAKIQISAGDLRVALEERKRLEGRIQALQHALTNALIPLEALYAAERDGHALAPLTKDEIAAGLAEGRAVLFSQGGSYGSPATGTPESP